MMIKEGTGNGTLVKNEQEFCITACLYCLSPVLNGHLGWNFKYNLIHLYLPK